LVGFWLPFKLGGGIVADAEKAGLFHRLQLEVANDYPSAEDQQTQWVPEYDRLAVVSRDGRYGEPRTSEHSQSGNR
jgi:hypothetical protein